MSRNPTDELDKVLLALIDMQTGTGTHCCPICYHWYDTHEEKTACLVNKHGYETLRVEVVNEPK